MTGLLNEYSDILYRAKLLLASNELTLYMANYMAFGMDGQMQPTPSSNGMTNYYRLVTLLLEEGTPRLRHYLQTHLPHGMSLEETILNNDQKLKLLKLKEKKIDDRKWRMLFPKSPKDTVNIEAFDVTMCIFLIRNIANNENKICWDKAPRSDHNCIEHDIVRLKLPRNKLSHTESNEIPREEFCTEWKELARILTNLGTSPDTIANFCNRNLDPVTKERYHNELQNEYLEEQLQLLRLEKESRNRFKISMYIIISVGILAVAMVLGVMFYKEKAKRTCMSRVTLLISGMYYVIIIKLNSNYPATSQGRNTNKIRLQTAHTAGHISNWPLAIGCRLLDNFLQF